MRTVLDIDDDVLEARREPRPVIESSRQRCAVRARPPFAHELLALAVRNNGRLVTFDQGVRPTCSRRMTR